MTENPPPPTSPPPLPPAGEAPPKKLLRSRTDKVAFGVCGGVARYFGVDATVVRIAAIALTLFGGAGALLYLAALVLVPEEAEGTPGAAALDQPARNKWLVVLGVVALVIAAGPVLFLPAAILGGVIFPLAVLVLAGLLVAWLVTGRKPDRDATSLTRATLLGLGVLLLVTVLAAGAFWAAAAGGEGVIAGLVIAAGVALLAGAFVKPVRWLILPALALALPAGFVAAAGIELDGGVGEKRYRPATAAEIRPAYELGAGELVVDLRGVDLPAGDRRLRLDVGMGHAQVLVDDDVCVATTARVGMGAVEVLGDESGGIDVDVDDMRRSRPGVPRIVLDADLGLGLVEVTHEDTNGRGPRFDWRDGDPDANAGCLADAA